jgi:hypothetical protein
MVLEPIKVNKSGVVNVARARIVESTAGFGMAAIVKGIFALAFLQALAHGHRSAVKRIRIYRRKRARIFG